jgi:hypothetical protein
MTNKNNVTYGRSEEEEEEEEGWRWRGSGRSLWV